MNNNQNPVETNAMNNSLIVENIINNINNIYENINITKAFFMINKELLDDIYKELKENDYPVCTLNESKKFINDKSRIILVNNLDISNIYENIELLNSLNIVNLICFIETPKIIDTYFYKSFFNIKNLNDSNIHIFQL